MIETKRSHIVAQARAAICFPVLLSAMLYACDGPKQAPTAADDTKVAVNSTECPTTKVNGNWKLLYTTKEGKTTAAATPTTLAISDCGSSTTRSGTETHSETFTLYRMKRYCADYQLTYPNDSIACISLYGDTLSMGECNNFGEMRWYYGRVR